MTLLPKVRRRSIKPIVESDDRPSRRAASNSLCPRPHLSLLSPSRQTIQPYLNASRHLPGHHPRHPYSLLERRSMAVASPFVSVASVPGRAIQTTGAVFASDGINLGLPPVGPCLRQGGLGSLLDDEDASALSSRHGLKGPFLFLFPVLNPCIRLQMAGNWNMLDWLLALFLISILLFQSLEKRVYVRQTHLGLSEVRATANFGARSACAFTPQIYHVHCIIRGYSLFPRTISARLHGLREGRHRSYSGVVGLISRSRSRSAASLSSKASAGKCTA